MFLGEVVARTWARLGVIAETGAGQHGVATAPTACALLGLDCIVYMGVRPRLEALNVARMCLGAEELGWRPARNAQRCY